jgi:hypothetical protein
MAEVRVEPYTGSAEINKLLVNHVGLRFAVEKRTLCSV